MADRKEIAFRKEDEIAEMNVDITILDLSYYPAVMNKMEQGWTELRNLRGDFLEQLK